MTTNQLQKSLIRDSGERKCETRKKLSGLDSRSILFRILAEANQGQLALYENGKLIEIFGNPSCDFRADINIRDLRCYRRALLGGDTAAGEAFVDGWWSTNDLTCLTRFFARNLSMLDAWERKFGWLLKPMKMLRLLKRKNSAKQAKENILSHYDLGNDLYESFLDKNMQYSSAVFNSELESLDSAQNNKLHRICEQLQLTAADHLLEIGTGWGGLATFAAKYYHCKVTTTTLSDAQYEYSQALVEKENLQSRVTVINRDYRAVEGVYDKVVSIEMIESVGKDYMTVYFKKLNSLLKPDGLLLIQAITIADQRLNGYSAGEDFIQKHIFPGGFLPSVSLLNQQLSANTDLVIRDLLDIGLDYAQTIRHWRSNLLEKKNQLHQAGYDEKFMRLWLYYFGYCEGGFLERRISAIQLLASKAPHSF